VKVAIFIARRYFFSAKKTRFINILSLLSMAGVGVGTMALVVVLSVFNGLEGVIREMFGTYDPEIRIEARRGKRFQADSSLLADLRAISGVAVVSEVAEDQALIKYRDAQAYVRIKGVSENYHKQNNFKETLVMGDYELDRPGASKAIIGRGVQYQLSASGTEDVYALQCWYPRHRKQVSLNPANAFNIQPIPIGGVFAIEKAIDDHYIYVPIDFARSLFGWEGKVSALEVRCSKASLIPEVQQKIKEKMGEKFKVLNADEQHASLIKAIRIEKFFVFLTFSFVLAISSINIIFSLYMLILEKQPDMAALKAMGASDGLVRSIFLVEGLLIGLGGALLGMLLGYGLCAAQQSFGFVSMGMSSSLVDAYPVEMRLKDFLFSALAILLITVTASWIPARKAAATKVKDFLR
jgi:lipoprotein-releasing system permease protein